MSDREILIEIATRQAALERKVDGIKCPSPRCANHESRLNTLETTAENSKDSAASIVAWMGLLAALVASAVAVFALLGG
jgi:hypothetical protein